MPAGRTTTGATAGRGAQRTGCGNMIPLAAVDQAVLNRISYLSNEPELRTVTVKGRDVKAEIDGLTADLRALDVMADDFIERAAAMKAEIAALVDLPPTADVVKQRPGAPSARHSLSLTLRASGTGWPSGTFAHGPTTPATGSASTV